MTPHKLALLIALGFVLGTFPVLGFAAILCVVAAPVFRLNMAALQIVGQIVTPAQYALLVPFARIGARVTGAGGGIPGLVLHAITGWLCLSVPVGLLLYIVLRSGVGLPACALFRRGVGLRPAPGLWPFSRRRRARS